jgi:hypothetical protein
MNYNFVEARWFRAFLLAGLYFLAAAASFSGYFGKWQFLDQQPRFNYNAIVEGTAERPFVYRQLLPSVSVLIAGAIPQSMAERIRTELRKSSPIVKNMARATQAGGIYALEYHITYFLVFGCLWLSLHVLRRLLLDVSKDPLAATLTPVAFALLFPLLLTRGGYYYDLPELLFLSLGFLLAWRARLWTLALVVVPIATLNKESYLLYLAALLPIILAKGGRAAWPKLVAAGLIAVAINLFIRNEFASNPGVGLESHWENNLHFYFNPKSYFLLEGNYGIVTTQGVNVVFLLFLYATVRTAWRHLDNVVRNHIKLTAAINLPLFFLFCWQNELRNLSLLYVGFIIMVNAMVSQLISRSQAQPVPVA